MRKRVFAGVIVACVALTTLAAQVVFTKGQVADRIRKVEDGVDEFRKWAENRADKGKDSAQAAKASGRARGRTATQAQKDNAYEKKDELDEALGDLNRSTNRLRRKFDPTDKWMETRVVGQFERRPRKNMTSMPRAAPKHIPVAINWTTSTAWNMSKRGLLATL